MKWLVVILLLVGCSPKVEDTPDTGCLGYYSARIGVQYAREVCK